MKVIVCDVGNAACAIVVSKAGHVLMIDCGSNSDKDNPVDVYKMYMKWLGVKDENRISRLIITHPDDDHVRNIGRVFEELRPFQLTRQKCRLFTDRDAINQDYKNIEIKYSSPGQMFDCGFDSYRQAYIPVDDCREDESLSLKERNNSSIVCYIREFPQNR